VELATIPPNHEKMNDKKVHAIPNKKIKVSIIIPSP
jgi:hypothetical protein